MLSIKKNCFYFFLNVVLIVSCTGNPEESNSTLLNDSLTAAPSSDSVAIETAPLAKDSVIIKNELIGRFINSLEDTVILKAVYGSYRFKDDNYIYNFGPQIWDVNDSVYMKVCEIFGNNKVKIVYIRGTEATSDVMHNHYNETALLLNKTSKQWEIVDAYTDNEIEDHMEMELEGMFFGGFLVKRKTDATYAGGVNYSSIKYCFINTKKLSGPSATFMSGSSNGLTDQCFSTEDKNYHCDCYSRSGEVSLLYIPQWKCMRFKYDYESVTGDCEMKNADTITTHQTWYMNADTCFQAKGAVLSDWTERIIGKVNLTEAQVKKLLNIAN